MYVGKITGQGWRITASIYQKFWSEEFSSNQIELIDRKNFFFKRNAERWIDRAICNDLVKHRRLEIVDE